MKRREFITLLGGAVAVWPLAVRGPKQRGIINLKTARALGLTKRANVADGFTSVGYRSSCGNRTSLISWPMAAGAQQALRPTMRFVQIKGGSRATGRKHHRLVEQCWRNVQAERQHMSINYSERSPKRILSIKVGRSEVPATTRSPKR